MLDQGIGATDPSSSYHPKHLPPRRTTSSQKKLIELMKIPARQLQVPSPTAFGKDNLELMASPCEISIFLFLNDRSLLFDPVDWGRTKDRLLKWAESRCPTATTSSILDLKFAERILPSHTSRVNGKFTPARSHLLTIMEAEPGQLCYKDLRAKVKNGEIIQLIKKINKGNKQAATIGLFPRPSGKRRKRRVRGR